jgi:C4-dicarboxylate transporter DctM subunit
MVVAGTLIVFLLLLAAGMPVNFCLGLLGIAGLFFLGGGTAALNSAAIIAWSQTNSFTLVAIPLFILMGEIILRAAFSKDLFDAARTWFGRLRGGLGIATIFASGIFAAVSGYKKRLIYGTMTAGGSLAILIPPSVILIIYGSFTEQSIGKLFLGGFIPGIILVLLFMAVIVVWTFLDPKAAPVPEIRLTLMQKVLAVKGIWSFLVLMVACLGTIYMGVATPTEAAGLGASGSMFLALIMRRMTWQMLKESLLGTVKVTCMVLFLILGGLILSNVMLFQNVPNHIVNFATSLGLPNWGLLLLLYFIYLVMGCFIDGITIMIITLPIVAPLITAMGMSLLWFGIAMVILVELSQLTPPVGMNLYIIRNISGGKIEDVIMGSLPFLIAMALALLIITVFPSLALYLPELIMR